jgi:signal transduction protein with GAF and PtsI domain
MKKTLLYLFATILGVPFPLVAQSQTLKEYRTQNKLQKVKVAPDLEELLEQDDANEAARLQGKTLAEVRRERLVGKVKLSHVESPNPSQSARW